MFKKLSFLMLGLPLVGAIAGPLAYFKLFAGGNVPAATTAGDPPSAAATVPASFGTAPATSGGATLAISGSPAVPHADVQVQDASRVFDFEITPEWILARWPGVATGLAQLQLEGYRVPLVTGTAQHDLAGSLTYYFDAQQKLQRITFVGVSGDPRPLMGLLANRFHMARRLTNDPGMVVYEAAQASTRAASGLHIRVAPPEPGEAYRHYDIEVSLERPE